MNPLPVSDVTDMFTDMKKNIADSFDKIAAEGSVNDVNSLALAYSTLISMASQNDSLGVHCMNLLGCYNTRLLNYICNN